MSPPTQPWRPRRPSRPRRRPPPTPGDASRDVDAARLEILRELERGDITVAEATDRLGQLDEVLR